VKVTRIVWRVNKERCTGSYDRSGNELRDRIWGAGFVGRRVEGVADIGMRRSLGGSVANDPGCVKTLRGITAPGILGSTGMWRAKKSVKSCLPLAITTKSDFVFTRPRPTAYIARLAVNIRLPPLPVIDVSVRYISRQTPSAILAPDS
jgi:hypothetical protein